MACRGGQNTAAAEPVIKEAADLHRAALACDKPAVIDLAVDPAALYSFRRDSFKHRTG